MPLRVLMILHNYPPAENIGAQRASRLVRHLPDLGIEPVVVTGPGEGGATRSGHPSVASVGSRLESLGGTTIEVHR
ncbi:MAG: hypothetical protein GF346_08625, partial [Candidatus Eisenbacteria bacterium]|nr:hypothetical protein [Candidatus Latescibacterota bacterium]MBD3302499.1 hypothetical protein [Candidatus Eisenbacteria bacterium]